MSIITVTKVGVLSIGKLLGTVNLIIGFAIGLIGAIAGTAAYLSTGHYTFLEGMFGVLAIVLSTLVLYPLVWFAFGWLYGVLVAFIFNVVVGVSGGVEMTVSDDKLKR